MPPMRRMQTVQLTVRMSTSVHLAAKFLSPGSGGIARCARLTIMAFSGKVNIKNAFAVQDTHPTTIAGVTTRPFRNSRLRFVSAHTIYAFGSDVVFYDFPGTARAHKFLALARKPYAVWVHGLEVWPEILDQITQLPSGKPMPYSPIVTTRSLGLTKVYPGFPTFTCASSEPSGMLRRSGLIARLKSGRRSRCSWVAMMSCSTRGRMRSSMRGRRVAPSARC